MGTKEFSRIAVVPWVSSLHGNGCCVACRLANVRHPAQSALIRSLFPARPQGSLFEPQSPRAPIAASGGAMGHRTLVGCDPCGGSRYGDALLERLVWSGRLEAEFRVWAAANRRRLHGLNPVAGIKPRAWRGTWNRLDQPIDRAAPDARLGKEQK
jgi:hypothetical protein